MTETLWLIVATFVSMNHVAWLVLLTVFSMGAKDTVGCASIYFIAKDQPWRAGIFDCLQETCGLASFGSPLAIFALTGISVPSALALVGMWAASLLGTRAGLVLSRRLNVPHPKASGACAEAPR